MHEIKKSKYGFLLLLPKIFDVSAPKNADLFIEIGIFCIKQIFDDYLRFRHSLGLNPEIFLKVLEKVE